MGFIGIRSNGVRLTRPEAMMSQGSISPDPPINQRINRFHDHQQRRTLNTRPYTVPYGYGIVDIDAVNGDIRLRARYDKEILVEP